MYLGYAPCADPEKSVRVLTTFLVINVFHRGEGRTDLPRKAIGQNGSNCVSRGGGSLPVFLRKTITTCDFPGGCQDPLSPFWIRPCALSIKPGLAISGVMASEWWPDWLTKYGRINEIATLLGYISNEQILKLIGLFARKKTVCRVSDRLVSNQLG